MGGKGYEKHIVMVSLTCLSVLAFASCKESEHEHTFGGTHVCSECGYVEVVGTYTGKCIKTSEPGLYTDGSGGMHL